MWFPEKTERGKRKKSLKGKTHSSVSLSITSCTTRRTCRTDRRSHQGASDGMRRLMEQHWWDWGFFCSVMLLNYSRDGHPSDCRTQDGGKAWRCINPISPVMVLFAPMQHNRQEYFYPLCSVSLNKAEKLQTLSFFFSSFFIFFNFLWVEQPQQLIKWQVWEF